LGVHSLIEARGSLTPTVQKKQAKNGYNVLRASLEIFFALEVEKESLDHYHTESKDKEAAERESNKKRVKWLLTDRR